MASSGRAANGISCSRQQVGGELPAA